MIPTEEFLRARDSARAQARAAHLQADALRRQSDAAWLAGDTVEAWRLIDAASRWDDACIMHCRIAAVPP